MSIQEEAPTAAEQALLNRYEEERDKRLRKDGSAQYADVRDEGLQDLGKDPWVDYNHPRIQNPPLKDGDSVKFLIAGAGINGLLYAGRLIEAGFSNKDIVLVDIAGGFGGTWYWNRYPGLMCDIEGYCYLPFLEETGYMPKHKYSYGAEIRGQVERSAEHFGLQGQFCTKIDSQIWDDEKKTWIVKMTRSVGETPESITVYADFAILAGGVLSIPKVPKLPGWEDFRNKKHVFHSSRWDYAYTGGTQEKQDLTALKGKRIAIIGTGATAIQIVPELAKWADRLYVVQRTPTHVGPRNQTTTTPELWEKITEKKGWQHARRKNLNAYLSNSIEGCGPDVVNDGWTQNPSVAGYTGGTSRHTRIVTPDKVAEHLAELHKIDMPHTEDLRKHVDNIVEDKDTAEKLKGWYSSWCKRPAFNDAYLQAYNNPNVTLIDTKGRGLDAFSENGIVFDGEEFEVDAVVLATGFRLTGSANPIEKLGAVVKGRNGIPADVYWDSDDFANLLSVAVPHFPNYLGHISRGQANSYNLTSVFDAEAKLLAHIVKAAYERAKPGQKVVIESLEKEAQAYSQEIAKRAGWFSVLQSCTPGWYTNEGAAQLSKRTPEEQLKEAKCAPWGTGPNDWESMVEAYMAKGNLEGFGVEVLA